MLNTTARAVVAEPAAEPVSLNEAKKHLEIGDSDTAHDTQLASLIEQARQQWERDTAEYTTKRTVTLTVSEIGEMQFPHRPVSAISSITYYDSGNDSQTLSSSVYQLDTANNRLRLAYEQLWPATAARWDAVTITYTLGEHDDSTTVPAVAKQAMLLLIGYYFEDRDMMGRDANQAYERLVLKHMRSSYP